MKNINNSLGEQLSKALKQNKIKVKYPEGYKAWKQKFDYWYKVTGDLRQTLDIMYGPNGGVDNYKGSIYTNANFKFKKPIQSNNKKEKMVGIFEVKKK